MAEIVKSAAPCAGFASVRFELRSADPQLEEQALDLEISIDGQSERVVVLDDSSWQIVELSLPSTGRLRVVTIETDRAWSPGDGDRRSLGFAIRGFGPVR